MRPARQPVVLVAVALCLAPLAAQEAEKPATAPAPKVGPSDLVLGEVRVGAVVEASFGVDWNARGDAEAEVTVPPPLQVLATSVHKDEKGVVKTTVALRLATDRPGPVDAEVIVRRGAERATLKFSATITPPGPGGNRVLVVDTPFERDSSSDCAVFAAWRDLVHQGGLDVDYRLHRKGFAFDAAMLARVEIAVVGEGALDGIDEKGTLLLQGFVCGGGRLVLFANEFYGDTIAGLNRVAAPFGIRMLATEPLPGDAFRAAREDLPRHPLLAGVDGVSFRRPSPIEVGAGASAIVTVPGVPLPLAAIATTRGGGEIVAVGESLWWLWVGEDAGNARLLRNLLSRAPRLR